jgi:hypothetical protein
MWKEFQASGKCRQAFKSVPSAKDHQLRLQRYSQNGKGVITTMIAIFKTE